MVEVKLFYLLCMIFCLGPKADEWIQVDLKKPTRVVAVVTQGGMYQGYRTTSYKISFGNSTDAMQIIEENDGSDLVGVSNQH